MNAAGAKALLPAESLPRVAALRMLGCLAFVLAPHAPHLPGWALALVIAVIGWRVLATLRQWRAPPGWLRSLLAIATFAGIYLSFGRVSGQTAGVALLCVMAALKLTELSARRDLRVLVLLMYFVLITHFLFSQELWTAAYLLLACALITAVLIDAHHPRGALPARVVLAMGGRIVLQALPLMVLIFVLFPRIPGPLWGLPSDAGAARSGLSDSMVPGDISALIESDEPAFRVRFDGAAPPPSERYWRGPVFMAFDGRRWEAGVRPAEARVASVEFVDGGPAYRYEVILEATRRNWLLALELPDPATLPPDAALNADHQLILQKGELRDRKLYRLASRPAYRLQRELPPSLRELSLRLPRGRNPRTLALGRQWRDEGLDDAAVVQRALHRFHDDSYLYTLRPPTLGAQPVDDFLFETRAGFCEHYASAFAVLMRAAGIPARIVTGYQGGEKNAVGDYFLVRQSDAHAWAEVWLQGRGWVRVDPTAAVAPERIERSVGDALLGAGSPLPGFLDPARRAGLRFDLAARWDWVNAQWSRWVLGYGPELQRDFLARFGLERQRDMLLALTAVGSVLLGLLGLLWLLRASPRLKADPALRRWNRLLAGLARQGLAIRTGEGPRDFIERACTARPDLAPRLRAALDRYLSERYRVLPDASA